jgi:hypothetical protein
MALICATSYYILPNMNTNEFSNLKNPTREKATPVDNQAEVVPEPVKAWPKVFFESSDTFVLMLVDSLCSSFAMLWPRCKSRFSLLVA